MHFSVLREKFRNYLLITFYANKRIANANMIYSWSDLRKYININDIHDYVCATIIDNKH